jgi:hypothetical protein
MAKKTTPRPRVRLKLPLFGQADAEGIHAITVLAIIIFMIFTVMTMGRTTPCPYEKAKSDRPILDTLLWQTYEHC